MNADTIVTKRQDHVEAAADGEFVLMHVENGRFFTLPGTGRRVWELIDGPTTLGTLADQLTQEYDVDRDACLRDLAALCGKLEESGLIDVSS